jgi:hypothetical protein
MIFLGSCFSVGFVSYFSVGFVSCLLFGILHEFFLIFLNVFFRVRTRTLEPAGSATLFHSATKMYYERPYIGIWSSQIRILNFLYGPDPSINTQKNKEKKINFTRFMTSQQLVIFEN